MQWVGDHIEVTGADEATYVVVVESQVDIQGGQMGCLTGQNLSDYDYVSIGKDEFVPISVKPMTSSTHLITDVV
jgi:hypothetical protein